MMKSITHNHLVDIGAKWLYNQGYKVALKQLVTCNLENPDILGFAQNCSFVLEAKASRADFIADKKKYFRRCPDAGMGLYRSFICPKNLIKPEELPENWGLIYVNYNLRPRQIVKPKPFTRHDINAEMRMLVSLARRLVDNFEYKKYLYLPSSG